MGNKSRNRLAIFITMISLIGIVSGQLRSRVPVTGDSELSTVAGASLLDPQRFSMRQGFSMSFMSGSGLGSGSVSVYTNQLSYLVADNVMLNGTIHIAQPSYGQTPGADNLQMYYQTSLDWQPTDRMFIRLSLSNMPAYSRFGSSRYFLGGRRMFSPSPFADELE